MVWCWQSNVMLPIPINFTEIVSIPSISQINFLANGQYIVSMIVILVMILLLFCRGTTSITNHKDSIAYLFKDFIALLKLLHWRIAIIQMLHSLAVVLCYLLYCYHCCWHCGCACRATANIFIMWSKWVCFLLYVHSIGQSVKTTLFLLFILISNFSENMAINFVDFLMDQMRSGHLKMILALVEIDDQVKTNIDIDNCSLHTILLAIRKRLALRFLGEYKPFPKLFYKRCKAYSYSFWFLNRWTWIHNWGLHLVHSYVAEWLWLVGEMKFHDLYTPKCIYTIFRIPYTIYAKRIFAYQVYAECIRSW